MIQNTRADDSFGLKRSLQLTLLAIMLVSAGLGLAILG